MKWARLWILCSPLKQSESLRLRYVCYNIDNLNERIDFLTEKLRLEELLNRITGELSSGQKNRASLAKALITNPRYYYLMSQQQL